MIKVNLIRNRVETTAAAPESTGIYETESSQQREQLIKVILLCIFTLGLYLYESQTISALNAEQSRYAAQQADLQAQADAKAAEVESVKDVAKQAQELEVKFKVLKTLSRLRLRTVKSLDFIQTSIPEKVWLKTVDYDSDKVRVEQGRLQFVGTAVTTDDLSTFVKRLEDSAYLQEVIVTKNQEIVSPGKTAVRDFQFTAEMENKN